MPRPTELLQEITVLILAGGRGERLGGKNKGLISLNQLPLIEHIRRRIPTEVAGILVSANTQQDDYERLGYRVVADSDNRFAGPMAGIVSCLPLIDTPAIQIISCDTPFIPRDLLLRLAVLRHEQQCALAIPHDGQRLQPLCMQLETSLIETMRLSLQQGHFAVHRWLDSQSTCQLDCSQQSQAFFNINTEHDLNTAERLMQHEH